MLAAPILAQLLARFTPMGVNLGAVIQRLPGEAVAIRYEWVLVIPRGEVDLEESVEEIMVKTNPTS